MTKKCKGKYTFEQLVAAVVKHKTVSAAAAALGLYRTTLDSFLRDNGGVPQRDTTAKRKLSSEIAEFKKPVAGGDLESFTSKRETLKGKRFVFTCAQNNTHINKKFWKSLQVFCNHKDAELHVSRFTYNKSGFQNASKTDDSLWYAKELAPHILDLSVEVSEGLIFCGELDILPTAEDPLSGFASYAGYNSAIVPHAKMAMKSMPRLKGEFPRFLYTTGTVTQRNYIQRKAGQKAEFHHVYGALYVEVDKDGLWFARQLVADNKGEFYDLEHHYAPGGFYKERVEAITYGDIHIEKEDKDVSETSWNARGSMLNTLQPKYQFVHDLTDFSARNHHEINNPFFIAKKHFKKEDSVKDGLKKSFEFLDNISKKGKVIVVESNHHEAFERWLRNAEGHRDPVNAEFFHEANARIFKSIRLNEKGFDIYEWALREFGQLDRVQFLKTDESFTICGMEASKNAIECGIHGHLGIDGARGASRSYRSIGRRVNVGHSHSAGICDGVYIAGVSGKLDMDYNRGPSSWSHSHIITYANGKRAIVTIKNGKWRV